MQPVQTQIQIEFLLAEIQRLEKALDIAMKNDRELLETKKLLHEIRLLRERLGELSKQKETAKDI